MHPARRAGSVFRAVIASAALIAASANAVEFRSVGRDAALLYDAPALSANRVAILTRGYPVEVVAYTTDWVKVRDASGQLLWIEAKALNPRRSVMVVVHFADVRAAPDGAAPLAFRAEQQVILELLDTGAGAWIKVRHRDGASGYVQADQVWGL